jgi:hypothetical protein
LPIFDHLPTKIGFAEKNSKKRLGLVSNPKQLLGYTGGCPTSEGTLSHFFSKIVSLCSKSQKK